MGFSDDQLEQIYGKTGGYCYHCGTKLAWGTYGLASATGAWRVDRSRPRGLTDHPRPLVPSCMQCNSARQEVGQSRRFQWKLDLIRRPRFTSMVANATIIQ
jgi:hypothetical protein